MGREYVHDLGKYPVPSQEKPHEYKGHNHTLRNLGFALGGAGILSGGLFLLGSLSKGKNHEMTGEELNRGVNKPKQMDTIKNPKEPIWHGQPKSVYIAVVNDYRTKRLSPPSPLITNPDDVFLGSSEISKKERNRLAEDTRTRSFKEFMKVYGYADYFTVWVLDRERRISEAYYVFLDKDGVPHVPDIALID